MKNKKILALLLACTIMASGVPVYAADFSDGTAESVQDAESSLFGMEDSELTGGHNASFCRYGRKCRCCTDYRWK